MATSSSSIFLDEGKDEYQVHPVVVLSMLDAYKRRPKDTEGVTEDRVIGTLLGERQGNKVYIKESFPVPYTAVKDEAMVNTEYHRQMTLLKQRVNPKLEIVGWFSVGSAKLNLVSSLIHQSYEEMVAEKNDAKEDNNDAEAKAGENNEKRNNSGSGPVLLVINTALRGDRLNITAYRGSAIKVAGQETQMRYDVTPLSLYAHESDRIGMDYLINDNPESENLDAPASIDTDVDAVTKWLSRLNEELDPVNMYLVAVASGKVRLLELCYYYCIKFVLICVNILYIIYYMYIYK